METIIKTNKITSNDAKDLVQGVLTAVETIKEVVVKKGWRGTNIIITEDKLLPFVIDLTLNQRKKLKRKINNCINKKGLRAINTFLHFLHRQVYKESTTVPDVRVSLKEENIQKARKTYVEARKLAEKYRKIYKEEKGDFYKNKLI